MLKYSYKGVFYARSFKSRFRTKSFKILADFATANQSACQVFSVNVDLNQELAAKFQVQGIPCLVLFKDGQEADRRTGVQSKTNLAEFLGAA